MTSRRAAAVAVVIAALSVTLVAGAASRPAGVKAWLGVWKARWGTVVFDSAHYVSAKNPQDFV